MASTALAVLAVLPTLTGCGSAGPPGRDVFVHSGCGRCHTLRAAGTRATLGPDLDQVRPTRQVAFRWLTYGAGGMPSYAGVLTKRQMAQVVAFVVGATRGRR